MGHAKIRSEQAEDDFLLASEADDPGFAATAGIEDSGLTFSATPVTNLQSWIDDIDGKLGLRVGPAYSAQNDIKVMGASAPVNLSIPASTIVGRQSTGDVDALTDAEVRTLINVSDGADNTAANETFGTNAEVFTAVLAQDGPTSGLSSQYLGGQDSSYHLNRANHSGTQLRSTISDFAAGVAAEETSHADVLVDGDVGVSVQGYDANTAFTDTGQTWTAGQTFNDGIAVRWGTNSDCTVLFSEAADEWQFASNKHGGSIIFDAETAGGVQYDALKLTADGQEIYYQGTVHLATDAGGVAVTGDMDASGNVTGTNINDTNWDTAYTHSQATSGNPHSVALSDFSVTATATELNVLDGIPATLTATELGYSDGVTSGIQGQLNDKQDDIAGATLTDIGTPASGDQVLIRDISATNELKWADFAEFGGGSSTLGGLTDVTETSVTNDEVLQYTGSVWENQTLAEAGIAAAGDLTTHTSATTNPHSTTFSNLDAATADVDMGDYMFTAGEITSDGALVAQGGETVKMYYGVATWAGGSHNQTGAIVIKSNADLGGNRLALFNIRGFQYAPGGSNVAESILNIDLKAQLRSAAQHTVDDYQSYAGIDEGVQLGYTTANGTPQDVVIVLGTTSTQWSNLPMVMDMLISSEVVGFADGWTIGIETNLSAYTLQSATKKILGGTYRDTDLILGDGTSATTPDLRFYDTTNPWDIFSNAGNLQFEPQTADGRVEFKSLANTLICRVNTTSTGYGGLQFADGIPIRLGSYNGQQGDAQISWDNANNRVVFDGEQTDCSWEFFADEGTTQRQATKFTALGQELYYQGSKKFETNANGMGLTGEITFTEQADHGSTPTTGEGYLWARTDGKLIYTDDVGTDNDLTSGGGATAFTGLTDTPAAYTAQGKKFLRVDASANQVEFVTVDDLDAFGTTFNADDLLILQDLDDAVPQKVTAQNFMRAYGLSVSHTGTNPFQADTSGDSIIFKEESLGNQTTIFDVQDSGGNAIFRINGGAVSDHITLSPGDYLELSKGHMRFAEISVPGTPATGTGYLYLKTNGKFAGKDDAGTETEFGSGSSGISGDFNRVDGSFIWNTMFDPGGGMDGTYDPSSSSVMSFSEGLGDGVRPSISFVGAEGEVTRRKFGITMMVPDGYDNDSNTLAVSFRARGNPEGVGGSKIDCAAFEGISEGGSVGSDLVTTAQTDLTSSWADYDFNLTDTALAAGDVIWFEVQIEDDNQNGGTPVANAKVQLDSMWLTVG